MVAIALRTEIMNMIVHGFNARGDQIFMDKLQFSTLSEVGVMLWEIRKRFATIVRFKVDVAVL